LEGSTPSQATYFEGDFMRQKVTKLWRETEEKRIASLDNKMLFEETLSLAIGDDYDGCFTPKGGATYEMLDKELRMRLKDWFGE
jgi:hypothetical protein